jgi:hypothetical protein
MSNDLLKRYREQKDELESREKSLLETLEYTRIEIKKANKRILFAEGKLMEKPEDIVCIKHATPFEEIGDSEHYNCLTFGCPECKTTEAYECRDCGIVKGRPKESPLPKKIYGDDAKIYSCSICDRYLGSNTGLGLY